MTSSPLHPVDPRGPVRADRDLGQPLQLTAGVAETALQGDLAGLRALDALDQFLAAQRREGKPWALDAWLFGC